MDHHRRHLAKGLAELGNARQRVQGRQRAVAGGGVLGHDDVSALLAAEDETALAHGLENVPVSYRGLDHADARGAHRSHEAEVGHHGGDHGVAHQLAAVAQGECEEGEDLVTVDHRPVRVDGEEPIGVAVVRNADIGAVRDHGGLEVAKMGGATAVVDVEAVGARMNLDHLGACEAVGLRGHPAGRAVGAVDHHAQAVEAVRKRGHEVGHVVGAGVGEISDPAHRGTDRPVPRLAEPRLDAVLEVVGQLVATTGEELDAVVGHGIVRGGEHHPDVGAVARGEPRHRRGRENTYPNHVDSGACEPRNDGGLEELAGRTGVTTDDGEGTCPLAIVSSLSQDVSRSHRQVERELGGELTVGQAPHSVGAEEPAHA